MSVFANIKSPTLIDGKVYCAAAIIPSLELDLGAPFPVLYNSAISAVVEFTALPNVASQASYVVMQTDWGDGTWIDLAWCNWSALTPATFILQSLGNQAPGVFQQTRASGATPSPSNSSNPVSLGGRIRFVGKGTFAAGSSSSSSSGLAELLVTIRYKMQGLR
jgi:hypothetical protein